MQQPLLGPKQGFPQRCSNCGDRFETYQFVVMTPVLREGERLCVGRMPGLSGHASHNDVLGKVLWYDWKCEPCYLGDGEPLAVKQERIEAEHSLNLSSSMMSRRLRAQRSRGDW